MFRPHKIKWSDYRSKIVPDAKKQPIRHSQMERLMWTDSLLALTIDIVMHLCSQNIVSILITG